MSHVWHRFLFQEMAALDKLSDVITVTINRINFFDRSSMDQSYWRLRLSLGLTRSAWYHYLTFEPKTLLSNFDHSIVRFDLLCILKKYIVSVTCLGQSGDKQIKAQSPVSSGCSNEALERLPGGIIDTSKSKICNNNVALWLNWQQEQIKVIIVAFQLQ